jgi:hypothetical protein
MMLGLLRGAWRARLAVVLVSVTAAGLGVPRAAAATTTGAGAFSGTVTLPIFPCPTAPTCTGGTFTGTAALSLSGVGTATMSGVPVPYTAAWPATPGNLTVSSFNYFDDCAGIEPPGVPPLLGNAQGTLTLSGGTLVLGGGTLGSATLTGVFNWDRTGTAVRVALTSLTITAGAGAAAVNLDNTIKGQSAAGFVWTNGPGQCSPGPSQTNQTAAVAGVTLQAA